MGNTCTVGKESLRDRVIQVLCGESKSGGECNTAFSSKSCVAVYLRISVTLVWHYVCVSLGSVLNVLAV